MALGVHQNVNLERQDGLDALVSRLFDQVDNAAAVRLDALAHGAAVVAADAERRHLQPRAVVVLEEPFHQVRGRVVGVVVRQIAHVQSVHPRALHATSARVTRCSHCLLLQRRRVGLGQVLAKRLRRRQQQRIERRERAQPIVRGLGVHHRVEQHVQLRRVVSPAARGALRTRHVHEDQRARVVAGRVGRKRNTLEVLERRLVPPQCRQNLLSQQRTGQSTHKPHVNTGGRDARRR